MGQVNLKVTLEGEVFDTSAVAAGFYEHYHVAGFTTVKEFSNNISKKSFQYYLEDAKVFMLNFNGKSYRFYAEPNDILFISFEGEGLVVNGSRAKENTLWFELFGSKNLMKFPKFGKVPFAEKVHGLDSIRQYNYARLGAGQLSNRFKTFLECEIMGNYFYVLSNYLSSYEKENFQNNYDSLYYAKLAELDTFKIMDEVNSWAYLNALLQKINIDKESSSDFYTKGLVKGAKTLKTFHYFEKLRKHFLLSLANNLIYWAEEKEHLQYAERFLDEISYLFPAFPSAQKVLYSELAKKSDQINLKDLKEFSLPDAAGVNRSIFDYNGKPYFLLDFWATWCEPCMRSIPKILSQVDDNFPIQVNFVNIWDAGEKWRQSMENFNFSSPGISHFHADKAQSDIIAGAYLFEQIPQYFLLDENRNILYKGSSFEELMEQIKAIK